MKWKWKESKEKIFPHSNFYWKQKGSKKVLDLPFIEDEDLEDDADEDEFEPGMSTLLGFYQR